MFGTSIEKFHVQEKLNNERTSEPNIVDSIK